MTDLDNWPRVIQLAWLVADSDGNLIRRHKVLIKPQGWKMPVDTFWIDNGFSQEQNELEGIRIEHALDVFVDDLKSCECMVSHNMDFDYNVLGAEMIRAKKSAGKSFKKICTKEYGTDLCKLPGNYGKYKWPKLSELHTFLFSSDFENAHDALSDVLACMKCFYEMVKREVIQYA